jgi:serine O-acetyltransferase
MNRIIESDLYRTAGKVSTKILIYKLLKDPGFRFLFFFRKVKNSAKYSPGRLIYSYFYKRYTFKYGIQIPKSVVIGKGFLMPHQGGIVINSQSVIGDNCTLMHGVTLGNTKRGKLKGAPTIGNEVYIGPGAVIVGKITIGDNVLIAPNCYVNCDIPAKSIVIGNPCKFYFNEKATEGYINNIYKG